MEKKKKVGRPAKFVVLTPEEQTRLEGMIRCGKGRILLKADVSENGPGWSADFRGPGDQSPDGCPHPSPACRRRFGCRIVARRALGHHLGLLMEWQRQS